MSLKKHDETAVDGERSTSGLEERTRKVREIVDGRNAVVRSIVELLADKGVTVDQAENYLWQARQKIRKDAKVHCGDYTPFDIESLDPGLKFVRSSSKAVEK